MEIQVIETDTASGFMSALQEAVDKFEASGLEVTINNPHCVARNEDWTHYDYIAVVEGRKL